MDYTEPTEEKTQEQLDAEAAAKQAEEDAEIVARAKECYRLSTDATADWRRDAIEDLEFFAGQQWNEALKSQREKDGRPALTVNRLPQFVRQITNELRQMKSSVTVNPINSNGDIEVAEVLQGVIRNIEYSSNADQAYAAASQSAVITGLGYWDIRAEYEDEKSFDQKLTISRIKNPMMVRLDPAAREQAGDDARWGLIVTDISLAEWNATYPDKEAPKGKALGDADGDNEADWVIKDGVRIYEYRYIVEDEDTLFDVSDATDELKAALQGHRINFSSGGVLLSEIGNDFAEQLKSEGAQERTTTRRKALWCKIAGDEIVERGELAGKYLQLVRVVGSEVEVDGRTIYEGIVRHAKDTQRMLNYFVSAEAEAIALTPKAPWVVAEGQIEGYETVWENSNKRPQAVLTYKQVDVSGRPAPPPQRVMAEANVGAITGARQQAGEDLSEVTGIYPTQFGAPAPEQSGKAILARQSQGQNSNFHFTDNVSQSIRYTGRILLDLIPKIYSGPRIMRIVGEDGTQKMISVNGAPSQDGQPPVNINNADGYDAAVTMGPSYQSRRQQASAQLLELVRVQPMVGQIGGDIIVGSMDIPDGKILADRLKKMLPPEIRPPDDKQPPPQVLAQQLQQAQAMLQQSQQAIDQLTQALNNAHDRIDAKEQDIASKERIALINAQTELVKTAAQLNSDEAQGALDHAMSLVHKRLELDGINQAPDTQSTSEAPRAPQVPQKFQLQGAQVDPGQRRPFPGLIPAGPPGPAAGPGGPNGPGLPGAGPIGPRTPGGPGTIIP